MPQVTLGNTAVLEPYKPDPASDETKVRRRKDLGNQTTTFSLPPQTHVSGSDDKPMVDPSGWTFEKWLSAVSSMWQMHSDAAPAWVESNDETLQKVLAAQFGCREGRPKNWKVGK